MRASSLIVADSFQLVGILEGKLRLGTMSVWKVMGRPQLLAMAWHDILFFSMRFSGFAFFTMNYYVYEPYEVAEIFSVLWLP